MSGALGGLFAQLFGPTQAQQALAAGNYTDPSLLQADRAAAFGDTAQKIDQLAHTGAGPGAILGALTSGLSGAGAPQVQQRLMMAQEQAKTGYLGAETGLTQAQADTARFGLQKAQAMMRLFGMDPATMQPLAGGGAGGAAGAATAPPTDSNTGGALSGPYQSALLNAESGGNWNQTNNKGYAGGYQFGAARLNDLGMYKPAAGESLGKNEWGGVFNIPGMPDIKTLPQFLANPAAQMAAQTANEANTQQFIQDNGLTKYVGQTINGAPVTLNGMLAAAHLGGNQGMQRYLATNGGYNPSDGNTKLSDYFRRFVGTGTPQQAPQGPSLNPAQVNLNGPPPPPPPPPPQPAPVPMPSSLPPMLPPGSAPQMVGAGPAGPPGGSVAPAIMPQMVPRPPPAPIAAPAPAPVPIAAPNALTPAQRILAPPAATTSISSGVGVPPGTSTAGPMTMGGNPFGVQSTDSIPQAIAKLPPAMRASIGMSADPMAALTKLMYAPRGQLITGNPQNGLPIGGVYSSVFNQETGQVEFKQISKGVDPTYAAGQTENLAKQFDAVVGKPEFDTMTGQVKAAYQAAAQATPTPTSDFVILHAFAKANDPRAVVRPSTMELEMSEPNLQEQFQRMANLLQHGGTLTQTERSNMVAQLGNLYGQRVQVYNSAADEYRNRAGLLGAVPDAVAQPLTGPVTFNDYLQSQRAKPPAWQTAPTTTVPGPLPSPAPVPGPIAGGSVPASAPPPAAAPSPAETPNYRAMPMEALGEIGKNQSTLAAMPPAQRKAFFDAWREALKGRTG